MTHEDIEANLIWYKRMLKTAQYTDNMEMHDRTQFKIEVLEKAQRDEELTEDEEFLLNTL
jgi:hypothetical protein